MNKAPDHISDSEWELFDQYWQGTMNPAAQTAFEARLQGEPDLRGKFDDFQLLVQAVQETALREQLEAYHEEMEKDAARGRVVNLFRQTRIHWAAAALIVALAIPVWLQYQGTVNERQFNRLFVPDPGLPTVMGIQENYRFHEAMVDYKLGNYSSAIDKWEDLYRQAPVNDTLAYFLGVAYLANNRSEEAIGYLSPLLERESPVFVPETYYYLGMSFLKKGDTQRAVEYLEKSNTEEARKALQALR